MNPLLCLLVLTSSMIAMPRQDADQRRPVRIDPYVMLPQPMSVDELESFGRILMLSEAQENALGSLFRAYEESLAELWPQIAELDRREQDRRSAGVVVHGKFVARDPPLTIQDRYERATSIQRDARRIESGLRRLEDEFFSSLELILAEPQRDRLHEAMRSRKRIAYQVRTEALPGAQVDLIDLLNRLEVPFQDSEALSELVGAYEDQLVALVQSRHEAQRRTHIGDLQWLATHSGKRPGPEAIEERGRIRFPQIRLESSLRRLNVATVEALTFMLSEHIATAVLDEFHKVAHVRIPAEPAVERTRAVLESALTTDDLPDDFAVEIEFLREHFLSNHRRLQRRLSEVDFDHAERFYRTLSAHADDLDAHEAHVRSLMREIQTLCANTTRRVEELLALHEEN